MGFRKGRGCTDAIFALRQMCERTIEYNRELNIVFVDQEKAFDRVNRNKLWKELENYTVRGQLLDNIRAIYENSRSAVRTSEGLTEWFEITSGVRQGCVLSPLLFIIYMDRITKEANTEPDALNELLFADDQSLAHTDEQSLQHHTTRLNEECTNYDMKISIGKTETMKISRNPGPLRIHINNNSLRQVQEFKYLGSTFTEDGRLNREIETRVQKANNVSYQLAPLLKHPNIPMTTKLQMINTIFIPTLTYQCQTWTMNKTLEQRITTCKMRCLRRAVNKTRRDKIRNSVIREMVGTTDVMHHIEHQRIKWFGHLMRLPTQHPAQRAYIMKFNGNKARGRPRKTWTDGVKETLTAHGIPLTQALRLVAERRLFLPATPNRV